MILLTGDTHGDLNRILDIEDRTMTKKDILIICGDFGFVWYNESIALDNLYKLSLMNFQIAFIDGNHENFELLAKLEQPLSNWYGGNAGLLPYGIIHMKRGEVYTIDNKTIGVCGGAESIDKARRVNRISWWEEEAITFEQSQKLINNIYDNYNGQIDIMLTHDCPTEALQFLGAFYPSIFQWIIQENDSRRELDRIAKVICPQDKWYFGHHHIDKYLGSKYHALYTDIIQL